METFENRAQMATQRWNYRLSFTDYKAYGREKDRLIINVQRELQNC